MESSKFRAKMGRPFKYPAAWWDGNTRVITQPADFKVPIATMLDVVRERGRKMGGFCSASKIDDDSIKLCYYGPETPEAKAHFAKLRARKRRAKS